MKFVIIGTLGLLQASTCLAASEAGVKTGGAKVGKYDGYCGTFLIMQENEDSTIDFICKNEQAKDMLIEKYMELEVSMDSEKRHVDVQRALHASKKRVLPNVKIHGHYYYRNPNHYFKEKYCSGGQLRPTVERMLSKLKEAKVQICFRTFKKGDRVRIERSVPWWGTRDDYVNATGKLVKYYSSKDNHSGWEVELTTKRELLTEVGPFKRCTIVSLEREFKKDGSWQVVFKDDKTKAMHTVAKAYWDDQKKFKRLKICPGRWGSVRVSQLYLKKCNCSLTPYFARRLSLTKCPCESKEYLYLKKEMASKIEAPSTLPETFLKETAMYLLSVFYRKTAKYPGRDGLKKFWTASAKWFDVKKAAAAERRRREAAGRKRQRN